MEKQTYLIELTKTRTHDNKPYYLTAFNVETGFMGFTYERKEARAFTFAEAVQTCYAIALRYKGIEVPLMVKR